MPTFNIEEDTALGAPRIVDGLAADFLHRVGKESMANLQFPGIDRKDRVGRRPLLASGGRRLSDDPRLRGDPSLRCEAVPDLDAILISLAQDTAQLPIERETFGRIFAADVDNRLEGSGPVDKAAQL